MFPAHSDIEIDVLARDPDGSATKVEFYTNAPLTVFYSIRGTEDFRI